MKKLIFLLLAVSVLQSCAIDDLSKAEEFSATGRWDLVRMSGSVPNSTQTGSDMEFQEFYILKGDGTFIKSRTEDGVVTTVSGTYEISDPMPGEYAHLIHKEITMKHELRSHLLATCYANSLEEDLFFTPDLIMVSNYKACDGPGLEYVKVNK